MDELINEDQIVQKDLYNILKDSITCPLCFGIYINPVMCMKCQNTYCKKCAEDWGKRDNKCPNRCENPNYQESIGKNEILSKLKFKCQNCDLEVDYNKALNHKDSCEIMKNFVIIDDPPLTPTPTPTPKKLKKLTSSEIAELKNKGNKVGYMTSKNKLL